VGYLPTGYHGGWKKKIIKEEMGFLKSEILVSISLFCLFVDERLCCVMATSKYTGKVLVDFFTFYYFVGLAYQGKAKDIVLRFILEYIK
jgi:hypothetical protein